jgi:hypothetical protein
MQFLWAGQYRAAIFDESMSISGKQKLAKFDGI